MHELNDGISRNRIEFQHKTKGGKEKGNAH